MTYHDVNVTSAIKVGEQVRVCNKGWSSFVELDKVAVINGSVLAKAEMEESQAMGLLQVLRTADSSITASWALQYCLKCNFPISGTTIQTPNNRRLQWSVACSTSYNDLGKALVNVNSLTLREAASGVALTVTEGIQQLPMMNEALVSALLGFTEVTFLYLDVGGGMISPQLAALKKLTTLLIWHYCLRGALPANVMASLCSLRWLQVVPMARAVGASDPAGGLCGLSGTLVHHTRPETLPPLNRLDLFNNQITGQLPPQLLSMAVSIDLSNNKISGSIPGLTASSKVVAEKVRLQGNMLEVSLTGRLCMMMCMMIKGTY